MIRSDAPYVLFIALVAAACGGSPSTPAPTLGQTPPQKIPDNPTVEVSLFASAHTFAVLGNSTVTSTGATAVNGNIGLSLPGTSITGFPPGTIAGGVFHTGDSIAAQAQSDLTPAYDTLAGKTCDIDLSGQDLGGMTLIHGVYCFTSSAQLTGRLILDAQGSADAVFIFKIASTLTTATDSSVVVNNGGKAGNVYWQVGSDATIGTTTAFTGNILVLSSITLVSGASLSGRALARNGAVTMDGNAIHVPAP